MFATFAAACTLLAGLMAAPYARAGTITLQIGDIQGTDWSAQGVSIQLTQTPQNPPAARISAARVKLVEAGQTLEQVTVTCDLPQITPPRFACPNARISGRLGTLGKQTLHAAVAYDSARGALDFEFDHLKAAGGTADIKGRWRATRWEAELDARDMQLAELRTLVKPWFELPHDYSLEGRGSVHAIAVGSNTLHEANADIVLESITANNAAGTVATDKLGLQAQVRVRPAAADWLIDARIDAASGQAYGDPIFVDLGTHPLKAAVAARWTADGTLSVDSLTWDQRDIAQFTAKGVLAFDPPYARQLQVQVQALRFPGAYTVLMQPLLLNTDFKDLTTSGSVTGTLTVMLDAPTAVDVQVRTVTAQDKAEKLGIEGLDGHLVWSGKEQNNPAPSMLTWKSAHAYGLSGAGAQLEFIANGKDFRLLQPTLIPVLDGGLFIQTLRVQDFGAENLSLRFEGEVRPIGMPLLSRAFGWPEFSGTLAGKIPEVSYEEGVLSVGGALEARAFDGLLRVEGLELQDALGTYPRLKANVTLRGLDLQAVTGTFSFGTITGRLDGEIENLELFRWTPVRMDARLYTPKGDKSRHLISQRAVKNLSSIGGGGGSVAAALQSGFLRFFENFRYSRLGLSCRLQNEVCHMDGVQRATGDAYYIVKGSGLPRIDIIGNARRVDWPRLVEQLKAVTESEGPVVQ